MDLFSAAAIAAAGVAAGVINAVVGSGTLITFPVLLALGYPPLLANVSNNIGLVPGVVAGAFGYRRELRGQRTRLLRLSVAAAVGSLLGALLLLKLPAQVFARAVPFLIVAACLLVALQPLLSRALERRALMREDGLLLRAGVCVAGVYGGYFGAAQGIVLVGLLTSLVPDSLHRLNAAKTVLAAVVNTVAALVFLTATRIDWAAAAVIAAGSTVGGLIGSGVGRRCSAPVLRALILAVGTAAVVINVVTQ